MYRTFYAKPKYEHGQYEKFVSQFMNDFHLQDMSIIDKTYYLENEDMSIKLNPETIKILIHDCNNKKIYVDVMNYFN